MRMWPSAAFLQAQRKNERARFEEASPAEKVQRDCLRNLRLHCRKVLAIKFREHLRLIDSTGDETNVHIKAQVDRFLNEGKITSLDDRKRQCLSLDPLAYSDLIDTLDTVASTADALEDLPRDATTDSLECLDCMSNSLNSLRNRQGFTESLLQRAQRLRHIICPFQNQIRRYRSHPAPRDGNLRSRPLQEMALGTVNLHQRRSSSPLLDRGAHGNDTDETEKHKATWGASLKR